MEWLSKYACIPSWYLSIVTNQATANLHDEENLLSTFPTPSHRLRYGLHRVTSPAVLHRKHPDVREDTVRDSGLPFHWRFALLFFQAARMSWPDPKSC